MPIRLTGMNSGLDTESIITELSKVYQNRVDKVKKQQTAYEWKQEAWKDLNSKIQKLFNTTLNNTRFAGDYSKKITDVTDSSVASIMTANNAMNTTQELKVTALATSAYMTGNEVKTTGNGKVSVSTKLTELGIAENSKINVTINGETTPKTITIDKNMTMGGLVSKLQSLGLEANFDEGNQRLHIASKGSGEKNSFKFEDADTNGALSKLGLTSGTVAKGTDAEITLNGVDYKSSTNNIEVNGLTITAKSKGTTSISTRRDTEGVYDMIKNFLTEYNALIGEMDKLYNAPSSKGYEPLTDEEREEMSEAEIEKWETKIKDSVLRYDSNLTSISSAMKNIMQQGIMVNGKQMYLSNFGVETLGYFNAKDNEKNLYHINGDEDDSAVSSKENDLKKMIATDPDAVISFFSQLAQNLYTELDKQSRSVEGLRSFGSFYDDKRMQTEYNSFADKIKQAEAKMTAYQDRWYNKFSAMETALAMLQSNQSAVSGLLGGM